MKRAGILP